MPGFHPGGPGSTPGMGSSFRFPSAYAPSHEPHNKPTVCLQLNQSKSMLLGEKLIRVGIYARPPVARRLSRTYYAVTRDHIKVHRSRRQMYCPGKGQRATAERTDLPSVRSKRAAEPARRRTLNPLIRSQIGRAHV